MDQLNNFADNRLLHGCVYCGGIVETREHIPSRVFLDLPYPSNLPVIGACFECNNSFSIDEEYVACLIEAVVAGSADPKSLRRQSIAATLKRSPALAKRLDAAKSVFDGGISFRPESDRVRRVVVKLAVCHAAYELSRECRDDPTSVWWYPIQLLTTEQQEAFNSPVVTDLFGEVGSRNMQRMFVATIKGSPQHHDALPKTLLVNDWVDVQEGRYRFLASDEGHTVNVRIVIGEYLAAEVEWHRQP